MKLDQKQIATILKEMAVLLELKGENPFKIRAYENASRVIEGLSEDLSELISSGRLIGIKGIGSGIAEKIRILAETGSLPDYDKLKSSIPSGLVEMLKIQGMGPKKIKAVWEKLGITTVGELEYACRENRLVDLPGFGLKSQEKILQGIEMLKKFKERHLLDEALQEAERIYEAIRDYPGVIRSQIAGSLRRYKETIKDIDILVSARDEDRMAIMNHFTSLPGVETVTAKGETKSSVVLETGINADLRIVSDQQYPYALHHFTGSKEHNIAMREHANKLGLKMNEYGLFRGEENIPCQTEEEIFHQLGMAFIPPELRENFGEIEAALQNSLPNLVTAKDIKGMIHVHSHYSDGVNSIEDLAKACMDRGYDYLVICDHSQAVYYANGLSPERVRQQHAEIDALNQKFNGFRILKGTECDILPDGSLDYPDDVLASFDIVIVSVHSKFNMTEEEATQRVIRAMENPYVTVLGHPTGRLLLGRDGYPIDLKKVIDAAAALGVAIELNTNPHRLDLDWRFCKYAHEKGVKVCLGTDAHRIEGLDDMRYGIGIARKGWLEPDDVLNTFSANELLAFAKRRRPS